LPSKSLFSPEQRTQKNEANSSNWL